MRSTSTRPFPVDRTMSRPDPDEACPADLLPRDQDRSERRLAAAYLASIGRFVRTTVDGLRQGL